MKANSLNRETLIEILKQNKTQLEEFGVLEIGLFGSYATSNENDDSDVDILVNLNKDKKTFRNFLSLNYFLEKLIGKKVDLVTRQSLSPYIGPHILNSIVYVPFDN
ncbi:nucleotidyltransferase family protein [Paucihalobacter ruber]|uniref:Nucleotidyltransferase family protein n=1 Tax=Paucihalobacter ruber TaxID=2567861 RepID=A0A506PIV7_9FLAO|nr:nucleotidyltransferase family protein [Paucihalobacter ruber]TPV33796.1 nucleotidyltransferase family protein [Paucihalobacter ruber]